MSDEKNVLSQTHQVAARSELLPESWKKHNINQTPPIILEIYSQYRKLGKLSYFNQLLC